MAGEALRLNPPLQNLPRRAVEDVTLRSGRTLSEGELIVVDVPAANLDVRVFGVDAPTFNPERDLDSKTRPYGLAFGLGAHMCSGRQVAIGQTSKGGSPSESGPLGSIVWLLRALYSRDVRRDPSRFRS